jgi:ubiquinone/menaquinone biosynthesis C-methylase UbiE
VEAHLKSAFYDMEGFMKGHTSLNEIELNLLGDVNGKSILHLQCHFGQDSISLSRMGAQVTGIDLSDKAIHTATEIAKTTHSDAKFICCDLYELPNYLTEKFDIVFTSYGTIGWLPDMDKWAKIVSQYIKPGGQFVFAEFHPMVWMYDDNFEKITYSYFNTGAIIETEQGTYADKDAAITQSSITWNHSMGEVINSLIKNGLELLSLEEFDYSPYNCFNKAVAVGPKKYRIPQFNDALPMVYAIHARKKN